MRGSVRSTRYLYPEPREAWRKGPGARSARRPAPDGKFTFLKGVKGRFTSTTAAADMFGKKPNTPALTDRVRAIATRPEPPPAPPPQAKARAARDSVFKQAAIILDSGARHSVAIKDISAGGARIEFFHDIALEGEFTISEPMTRLRRRARVAWRTQGAAGLVFTD